MSGEMTQPCCRKQPVAATIDGVEARGEQKVTVDRESCLFFEGSQGASRGVYRPTGYELHLSGGHIGLQHLTHLHEIHHKVLNDDTGWGSALHITARHEPWAAHVFPALLEACRGVHEGGDRNTFERGHQDL